MSALASYLHAAFHEPKTGLYRYVQGLVWALILFSILLLVVEALLPEETLADDIVKRVDLVLLTIFAVEIFLRVASFPAAGLESVPTSTHGQASYPRTGPGSRTWRDPSCWWIFWPCWHCFPSCVVCAHCASCGCYAR